MSKAGGTYRIHFKGALGGTAIALLGTDPTLLRNGAGVVDQLNIVDTAATADDAALLTSTSLTGLSLPVSNEIQQLVVDATSGQYTLTYAFPVMPSNLNATQATGGTLTAGTHFYKVTALTASGESLASNVASAVTADGGAVDLTWTGIAQATGYRIYAATSEAMDAVFFVDTGSTALAFHDIGGGAAGTIPTASAVLDHQTTGNLDWNADASVVQAALEALPAVGTGNVVVTRNDDVYTIRFQGLLSNAPIQQLVANAQPSLQKRIEQLGGGAATVNGTATVHTRSNISDTPTQVDQIQILTVDATGGSYRLTFHVNGVTFQTDPIPFNAGAEQLRQIIQNAIAAGETNDPFLRAYLVDKLDVTVDRYPSGYLAQNIYVLHFQGELRRESFGPGLDTITIQSSLTGGGTAWMTTRMDGIQYYGIESVNIGTGSGADVFNVQGTTKGSNDFTGTAVTNVTLGNGDDLVYLSSNADLDGGGNAYWKTFDFLTGNLDDFRGALNLDLGNGRHRLFMSDEASIHADTYAITDSLGDAHNIGPAGLNAGADIYVTRAGLPGISYKTSATGNLYDGVAYWTGSGNDTVFIDGTQNRPLGLQRTTTILNTGLGNDTVTANLTDGSDGFTVIETSGGSATGDPIAHALPAVQDNDKVFAQGSTLPLVIIGGFGNDEIHGGQGNDVVLGDTGIVQYVQPGATPAGDTLLAQFGFGGRGDVIDAQRDTLGSPILDPRWIYTYVPDMTLGGTDRIYGDAGEDVLIGGAVGDAIDGGTGDDLIFGDAVQLFRRDVTPGRIAAGTTPNGTITDPRFQALQGKPAVQHRRRDARAGAERGRSRGAQLPRRQRRLRARLERVPDRQPLPRLRAARP